MKHKTNRQIIAATLFAFSAAMLMPSQASAFDEDAARALAKRNDCFKCHAVDKTKKGPSYKKIAAKYKEKNLGEKDAIKQEMARLRWLPWKAAI
jgi:cytochrome c